MMTDARLWKRYPLLCLLRFLTVTIRTTALLFVITVISIATTSIRVQRLPWEFMCISCGLNWLLMLYFAIRLHRWKAILYPLMFLVNPFMNWIYMVYGIFTAGQRTWGGPRADAGTADIEITPQEAIEHAIATGDDLNVVPETFKPAIAVRRRRTRPSALQPSSSVEGRFVLPEHTSGHLDAKAMLSPTPSEIQVVHYGRRFEHDSLDMSDSEGISVHTPRRVISVSGDAYRGSMRGPYDGQYERGSSASGQGPIEESYVTTRSTATTRTLYPSIRRSVEARASRYQMSTIERLDSLELPRYPDEITSQQGTTEGLEHSQIRSPLGRICPLTVENVEEGDPTGQDMTDVRLEREADFGDRRRLRRTQLRKRSLSPSDLV